MRQIRIYQAGNYQPGDSLQLSPEASQHLGPVLRLAIDDEVVLFPGDNHEYQARLIDIQKKFIRVEILSKSEINRESPRPLHLGQAMVKGDKMEWIIQKAVELGASSITPLLAQRSQLRLDAQRLQKKQLLWQAIAISACEQSGRNRLPMIHPATSIEAFLELHEASLTFNLSPHHQSTWPLINDPKQPIALVIGPEGGFSPEEIELFQNHKAHPLRLGPRTLRAETAAITALSAVQLHYGDMAS